MKSLLLSTLLLICYSFQAQTTYTYTGTGDWDTETNWSPNYPGTTLDEGEELTITAGAEVIVSNTTNNGKIILLGTLENRSRFVNNGTVETQGDGNLYNRSNMTNKGKIYNNALLTNHSFFYNNDTIINEGTLKNNSSFYNNHTILNRNTINNNSSFFNNGKLTNNGTIQNNNTWLGENITHTEDFSTKVFFDPGKKRDTVGTYTFDASFTMQSSIKFKIDIQSATEADQVIVTNTATVDGKLVVDLLDGFIPEIGAAYTILTAGNVTGTFEEFDFADIGEGKTFEVVYTATSIILKVVDPSATALDDLQLNGNKVTIYPTPFQSVLHVAFARPVQHATVQLINIIGQVSYEKQVTNAQQFSIEGSTLASGTYFLKIIEGGQTITEKVVKQ